MIPQKQNLLTAEEKMNKNKFFPIFFYSHVKESAVNSLSVPDKKSNRGISDIFFLFVNETYTVDSRYLDFGYLE